jgi:hypothetical protein
VYTFPDEREGSMIASLGCGALSIEFAVNDRNESFDEYLGMGILSWSSASH